MPALMALVCVAAACAGSSGGASAADSYEITVSGGAEASIRGSEQGRLMVEDDVPGFESYTFRFADPRRERVVVLVFYGTTPPAAGSYDLGGEMGENPAGVVLASYADRTESATYGQNPSGTVILHVENGVYSGELQFEAGGGPPTDRGRKVKVEGRFAGVRLPDAS